MRQALDAAYFICGETRCQIHVWVPAFNPREPRGLLTPVWITLHMLGLEFANQTRFIAGAVGTVIDEDGDNKTRENHRFLVAIDIHSGWIESIAVEMASGGVATVLVKYETQLLRCSSCIVTSHLDKNCPLRRSREETATPY